LKKTIPTIGLVLTLAFLTWFFLINNQNQSSTKQEVTQLERMGDECVGISEKAVIGMTPVVEFQKLELLSRKANVLKNCMADRGFREDPAWRKYAEPLAKAIASEQKNFFWWGDRNHEKSRYAAFQKTASAPVVLAC